MRKSGKSKKLEQKELISQLTLKPPTKKELEKLFEKYPPQF